MKLFAVIMVLIAGTMWAGTGLAAQDFFRKSSLDAMDLTVFRMFSAGIIMFLVSLMKGQWKAGVRAVKRKPLLFLELVLWYRGAYAYALYLFCLYCGRKCGCCHGHPVYLPGHGDPVGFSEK